MKTRYYKDGKTKITDPFWTVICQECKESYWTTINVKKCKECNSTTISCTNPNYPVQGKRKSSSSGEDKLLG